jgi:hypothetical protein
MSEPASEQRCPICAALTFGQALCWSCACFREYAEPARALCDLIHRGIEPKRPPDREPPIIVMP